MSTFKPYLSAVEAPSLAEVQALPGLTLLEFGTEWCGHCRAAQALMAQLVNEPAGGAQSLWRHLKIEDGPGRVLGRHHQVKLWPTLVVLRDGQEVARLVRLTQLQPLQTLWASMNVP